MKVPHLGLRNTDVSMPTRSSRSAQGISFSKNVPTRQRARTKELGRTEVNIPKSFEGASRRQDFLKGLGSTPHARVRMEIDLTDVINSMEFMESVRQVFDDKTLHAMTVEYAHSVYAEELSRNIRGLEDRIAHVYEWKTVVDITEHSKSSSRSKKMDNNATFKPTIDRNAPLWRLNPPVQQGDSFLAQVGFMKNESYAMYDPRVYGAISGLQGPRRWGQHHFQDQAVQLEKVQKIMKKTSRVSSRRIGGGRFNDRLEAQIVQLVAGEGRPVLKNFVDYTRPNNFYRKFAEFFLAFSAQGVEGAAAAFPALEKDLAGITDKSMKMQLKSSSRQAQFGLQGASLSTGSAITLKPGATVGPGGSKVEVMLTANGRPISNVVAPKGKYRDALAEVVYKEIVRRTADSYANAKEVMGGPERQQKATRRTGLGGTSPTKSVKTTTRHGQQTTVQGARLR